MSELLKDLPNGKHKKCIENRKAEKKRIGNGLRNVMG
jgi:hypothetical protein